MFVCVLICCGFRWTLFGFLICWYCVAFFRLYDLFVVDCCVGVLLLGAIGYLFGGVGDEFAVV